MDKQTLSEKSIITTYRKTIWSPFISAIKEYELIKSGDVIAVCISGGKDSVLLAKCLQLLKKYGEDNFTLKFIVMDPGYNEVNRQNVIDNAKLLGIPIDIFNSNIFSYVSGDIKGSPCYLCARMRRGHLYNYAKTLGCNKIALGHHFNDVIETTLMSMLYNGQYKTMLPMLKSENFDDMSLIRPLYKVKESAIINWKNYNELRFINCACPLSEKCELTGSDSKRKEMKDIIETLKKINPIFEENIFTSLHNVNTDQVVQTIKKQEKTSFLKNYYDN